MILILLLFLNFSFSQQQTNSHVDGVVAVVGDFAILKSDVFEQTLLLAKQKNIVPQKSPLMFESLFKKVLNEKIDRLVVLNAAQKDTSIEVSFDEINTNLEDRISSFSNVFGSEKALEDTMKMSLSEIKAEYWDIVKEEIYVEKFRVSRFGSVSINRQEVEGFFIANPDSFPSPEPLAEFSILQAPIEISQTTKDSIFSFALKLKDSLETKKLSFEEAAKKYSQDPGSASKGGDLNYTKRGSLVPEYEKTAFSLQIGEVSKPIQSPFGLHLIKLLDRIGEKIHTQHILFSFSPGPKDVVVLKEQFNAYLENNFNDPGAFDSLCINYNNKFDNFSGYYIDFNINKLPLFLQKNIFSLENFSFSNIFIENSSIFLLYKHKQKKTKPLSLKDNWSLIESVALSYKRFNLLQEWINQEKEKTYIEIFNN